MKETQRKFLHLIINVDPSAVSGCFSTWPMCMCRIWRLQYIYIPSIHILLVKQVWISVKKLLKYILSHIVSVTRFRHKLDQIGPKWGDKSWTFSDQISVKKGNEKVWLSLYWGQGQDLSLSTIE